MTSGDYNLLVILGATASGKTRLGVGAARALNGEIVSADSRQVYRGMDLGTGKDLEEYSEIPCHLIDVADPGEDFSVFHFQRQFFTVYEAIRERGKLPVLVGGTGLYLDAVLRGYRLLEVPENPALRAELAGLSGPQLAGRLLALKPDQHNTTDLGDRQRLVRAIEIAAGEQAAADHLPPLPALRPKVFGLRWPRPVLRQRIARRLRQRLDQGLVAEVAALHAAGVPWERLDYFGLEYRFVARYLQGQLNHNDMTQKLAAAIAGFAKRQETFFRRMERRGVAIHWLAGDDDPRKRLLATLAP